MDLQANAPASVRPVNDKQLKGGLMGGMLTSAIIPRFSCCSFEISQGLTKYSTLCLKARAEDCTTSHVQFQGTTEGGASSVKSIATADRSTSPSIGSLGQFPHSWAAGRRRPAKSQGPPGAVSKSCVHLRHNSVAKRLERCHFQNSKACRDTPISSHVGQEYASIDLCHIASPVLLYQVFD